MFGTTSILALAATLATSVTAMPFAKGHPGHPRQGETFNINVINSCDHDQAVGIYKINSDYSVTEIMGMQNVPAGNSQTFQAPYRNTGLRLAVDPNQYQAQDLFEFGFSSYQGLEGTSYDLSMYGGTSMGMKVTPANSNCETKECTSDSCPEDQAWTDPNQYKDGSPADTTCYYGPTDFTVEYCPRS